MDRVIHYWWLSQTIAKYCLIFNIRVQSQQSEDPKQRPNANSVLVRIRVYSNESLNIQYLHKLLFEPTIGFVWAELRIHLV